MRERARRRRTIALWAVLAAATAAAAPALELRPRREPWREEERLAPAAVEAGQRVALRDGALLGEIELDAPWRDYRGQAIAPGRYALRYALQPRLKDHLGADAIRDFALLVPAGLAADEAAGGAGWIAASRRASGTAHPAVLALVARGEAGPPPAPRREADARRVEYLEVGGLVLGFVVAGEAERPDAF